MRVQSTKTAAGDRMVIKLQQDEPRAGHRPSIMRCFFPWRRNLRERSQGHSDRNGNDVRQPCRPLRNKGAWIIAEDQSSCVIYGMPKSAIESGYVNEVLPLSEISAAIVKLLQ